jgi:hypothetical protein
MGAGQWAKNLEWVASLLWPVVWELKINRGYAEVKLIYENFLSYCYNRYFGGKKLIICPVEHRGAEPFLLECIVATLAGTRIQKRIERK